MINMSEFRNSGLKNGVMISLASVSNRALSMLTIVEYQNYELLNMSL